MRFKVTGQAYTRSRYGSSLHTEGESGFWQVLDTFIGVQPGYVHSGDTLLSDVKQDLQHLSQLLYSDFLFVAVQLRLSVG